MMKMKRTLLTVAAIIFPLNCYAIRSGAVTIKRIAVTDAGIGMIYADNGWAGAANNGCSTGTGVLAFNANEPAGKSMLSLALSANAMRKRVIVTTHNDKCFPVGGMAAAIHRIDILN